MRQATLHYSHIVPNYKTYWMSDSDAVNQLDRLEVALWFKSRGGRARKLRLTGECGGVSQGERRPPHHPSQEVVGEDALIFGPRNVQSADAAGGLGSPIRQLQADRGVA